ncbi:hypothetical protein ACFY3M_47590 [Streptomyces mirabilis]|uniref:hypothetical protein n=1 Tax=Streptomyces mirabilis TaxID=68239 RepID=UPI00369E2EF9
MAAETLVPTPTLLLTGPVLRSRRSWLVRQGLSKGDESREELVVIRAEQQP